MTLARRIKRLHKGERFSVGNEKERIEACKIIKVLREAGVLTGEVITKKLEVIAL